MSIEYARLHSLTAREIISALNRDGFHSRSGRKGTGSHQRFQHPTAAA
jgi:predicted RNA binding protein YcfA (HicA-like mRNA interferase family)